MTEKRFTPKCNVQKCAFINHIKDNEKEVVLDVNDVVDLLNEQQAEIEQLKSDIEETEISIKLFEDDIATKDKKIDEQQATINELKERNAHNFAKKMQLQKEIKELKEEEKLYAKEIVRLNKNIEELNKTIEEALKFKSLGGDY